jgi:hypothetical protein
MQKEWGLLEITQINFVKQHIHVMWGIGVMDTTKLHVHQEHMLIPQARQNVDSLRVDTMFLTPLKLRFLLHPATMHVVLVDNVLEQVPKPLVQVGLMQPLPVIRLVWLVPQGLRHLLACFTVLTIPDITALTHLLAQQWIPGLVPKFLQAITLHLFQTLKLLVPRIHHM